MANYEYALQPNYFENTEWFDNLKKKVEESS